MSADIKPAHTGANAEIAEETGAKDDQRKRHMQGEDGEERNGGDRLQQPVLQRATANPHQCFEHDGEHRGFQAEKQGCDQRHAAVERINGAQRQDDEKARQHEQRAGNDAAAHAMHEPADIGGKLLRLRPRQQHAEIERMQKRGSEIQRRSSTSSRCISAIWPAGPPNDRSPIRSQTLTASAKETSPRGCQMPGFHDAVRAVWFGQLWVSPVASRHQR